MRNDCEACQDQLYVGILSHDPNGREYAVIERCDMCAVYGSDTMATAVFNLLMWVQAVIDDLTDETGNTLCMANAFLVLTNEED